MKIKIKDLKEMKKLREKGFTYVKIGKVTSFSPDAIRYHLNEKQNKRVKKLSRIKLKNLSKQEVKEKNKNQRNYRKKYMKEKYNSDEEFRKKAIECIKKSYKRKKQERIKKGLCVRCGGVRENKKWKYCERCRMKGRINGEKWKKKKLEIY